MFSDTFLSVYYFIYKSISNNQKYKSSGKFCLIWYKFVYTFNLGGNYETLYTFYFNMQFRSLLAF